MARTVDDFIIGALDNLSADHLDIFKHKLSARHEIGYGLIEKESNMALTKRIISKFTKKHAIARTAEVLRAMELHDQACDLEAANARIFPVLVPPSSPPEAVSAGPSSVKTPVQTMVRSAVGQGASSAAWTGDTGGRASDSSFTPTEVKEVDILEPRTREDFLQYSCYLTLDPNTVFRGFCLSERNRKVTYVGKDQSYPDHPERFDRYGQVLCRQGLSGRCYWEAEWGWRGVQFFSNLFNWEVDIAVSYKEISRKGGGVDCALGYNDKSWSWFCSSSRCCFRHNNEETDLPAPPSSRIGVYLDHGAGTLSFYSVSDKMTLLHRVQTTFTQPLHPGFRFNGYATSVKLCDLG